MSTETTQSPAISTSSRPPRSWGQIAIFVAGGALCLSEINDFLKLAGWGLGDAIEGLLGLVLMAAVLCGLYAFARWWRVKPEEERPHRLPWMRRANILLWCGVLILMLMKLMIPAFAAARVAVGGPVMTSDKHFAVDVPNGWKDISAHIPAKFEGLAIGDAEDTVAVFVISDRREDVALRTIDDYIRNGLDRLAADLTDFMILETTTSAVPGRPTREVLIGASSGGTKQSFLIRFYETPEYFVQVRAFGTPSAFRIQEQTLRGILGSFREVTSPSPK